MINTGNITTIYDKLNICDSILSIKLANLIVAKVSSGEYPSVNLIKHYCSFFNKSFSGNPSMEKINDEFEKDLKNRLERKIFLNHKTILPVEVVTKIKNDILSIDSFNFNKILAIYDLLICFESIEYVVHLLPEYLKIAKELEQELVKLHEHKEIEKVSEEFIGNNTELIQQNILGDTGYDCDAPNLS